MYAVMLTSIILEYKYPIWNVDCGITLVNASIYYIYNLKRSWQSRDSRTVGSLVLLVHVHVSLSTHHGLGIHKHV